MGTFLTYIARAEPIVLSLQNATRLPDQCLQYVEGDWEFCRLHHEYDVGPCVVDIWVVYANHKVPFCEVILDFYFHPCVRDGWDNACISFSTRVGTDKWDVSYEICQPSSTKKSEDESNEKVREWHLALATRVATLIGVEETRLGSKSRFVGDSTEVLPIIRRAAELFIAEARKAPSEIIAHAVKVRNYKGDVFDKYDRQ